MKKNLKLLERDLPKELDHHQDSAEFHGVLTPVPPRKKIPNLIIRLGICFLTATTPEKTVAPHAARPALCEPKLRMAHLANENKI